MAYINENYLNLNKNYLFAKISEEKQKYIKNNHEKKLIDLSIGDVTLPLTDSAIKGIHIASSNLSKKETFTGYPPSSGHDFLKKEIIKNDYLKRNISIDNNELFIGDSSKSDISNILDIFDKNLTVALQDPVYPVYVDSNIIRGNKIIYINDIRTFLPQKEHIDIIYLCFPNNPTGAIISKELLKKYVDYAIENDTIIFFDSAYEAFIQDKNTVHSIYEIENAKKVAVEFRSFSKTAGFTSIRLAYTIVPNAIMLHSKSNKNISLNSMFKRLKDTKYNGPSYISEYAIYNVYESDKFNELQKNINYYLRNTTLLAEFFKSKGMIDASSINSPYVWIKCKDNINSWDFFYYMLNNFSIIGTPGIGFGANGEGHFRLTGFGTYEDTIEAINRMDKKL